MSRSAQTSVGHHALCFSFVLCSALTILGAAREEVSRDVLVDLRFLLCEVVWLLGRVDGRVSRVVMAAVRRVLESALQQRLCVRAPLVIRRLHLDQMLQIRAFLEAIRLRARIAEHQIEQSAPQKASRELSIRSAQMP